MRILVGFLHMFLPWSSQVMAQLRPKLAPPTTRIPGWSTFMGRSTNRDFRQKKKRVVGGHLGWFIVDTTFFCRKTMFFLEETYGFWAFGLWVFWGSRCISYSKPTGQGRPWAIDSSLRQKVIAILDCRGVERLYTPPVEPYIRHKSKLLATNPYQVYPSSEATSTW